MHASPLHKTMSGQEFDRTAWMSVKAAAAELQIPRSKIQKLVMTRVLDSHHVIETDVVLVSRASVEAERERRIAAGLLRRKRR